ncbi:MAG: cysteine desulfurase family protein [Hyphomicrobiales bacterium]
MVASVERVYLDHNATSPLRPEARAAMLDALDHAANPSSVHREGRAAHALIETARDQVALLAGAQSRDVIFTSGGTEASILALTPMLEVGGDRRPFTHCLMSAVEHVCVLEGARFERDVMERIPVLPNGLVDQAWLSERLAVISATGGRVLVAAQAANNETGIVQPIAAIAAIVHAHGGILHCDAVQVAGKMPIDQVTAGADMLALSAHKIGGPQGVGALVLRSGGIVIGDRMLRGGGQERGARSGTENVAGIAGFGAAASVVLRDLDADARRLGVLRNACETAIRELAPDAVIFGAGSVRLPNTVAFSVPGLTAETALMKFDLAGISLSSGSACSSGKVKPSHVLEAMGITADFAKGALRLSAGWTSSEADVIRFRAVFERMRSGREKLIGRNAA